MADSNDVLVLVLKSNFFVRTVIWVIDKALIILRNKTIKGVGWSAADALLGQGVTFVTGLVLARLLSPEEYGLVGICLIFTTILNGIVDSGFSNALIRKKDTTNEDYNTMFITNLGISIVLYVLLFFASSNISTFFERKELTPLIKVMGSLNEAYHLP